MADIWRNPIFDRTYNDVQFALQQIAAWKQSHTHSIDLRVEEDKLIIVSNGAAFISDDSAILQGDGLVFVENEVLVLQLGTVYDLKGCLNLSDLTRIEDNTTYLATRLTQYKYHIDVTTKEWSSGDLPTAQDMTRIGHNIGSIIKGFSKSNESTEIPSTMLSYEDINSLEKNLYLLKQLLDAMIASFVKSGTHKSGATNRLPIRR